MGNTWQDNEAIKNKYTYIYISTMVRGQREGGQGYMYIYIMYMTDLLAVENKQIARHINIYRDRLIERLETDKNRQTDRHTEKQPDIPRKLTL